MFHLVKRAIDRGFPTLFNARDYPASSSRLYQTEVPAGDDGLVRLEDWQKIEIEDEIQLAGEGERRPKT